MPAVQVTVVASAGVPADPALLTPAECEVAAALRGRRRDEWIRGRVAIHGVLGAPRVSALVAGDGAPMLVGDELGRSISLSHDGAWIAVAVARRGAVGVDLTARCHAAQCARVIGWLGVRADGDAVAVWAALEAALKLRRRSVVELRGATLAVHTPGACSWLVDGLGARVAVAVDACADYALAVAAEDVA